MLRISKLTDYATVILARLAAEPERRFTAGQLAGETRLAVPTVSKLLKQPFHRCPAACWKGVARCRKTCRGRKHRTSALPKAALQPDLKAVAPRNWAETFTNKGHFENALGRRREASRKEKSCCLPELLYR